MAKKLMILAVLFISACTTYPDGKTGFDWAKPVTLNTTPPEGPYNYRKGWSDGCQSGLTSTNGSLYQLVGAHQFILDSQMVNDRLYNMAWRYGYNHCGYSMRTLARYDF